MFYCLTKMFKNSSVRKKKLMKNQTPTEYNITNRGGLIVAEKFSELLAGHPAVFSSSPFDCSNCSPNSHFASQSQLSGQCHATHCHYSPRHTGTTLCLLSSIPMQYPTSPGTDSNLLLLVVLPSAD